MTLPNPSLADLEREISTPRPNPARRYITSDTRSLSLSSLPFDDRYLGELAAGHGVDRPKLPDAPMPDVAPESITYETINSYKRVPKPLSPPSNPQWSLAAKNRPFFPPVASPTSSNASIGLQPLSEIVYMDLYNSPQARQHVEQTGHLPPWLQQCRSLQYLIAPKMGLKAVDEWVSRSLVNLKVLDVHSNDIAIFPDHLARISGSLLVVNLDDNPCLDKLLKRNKNFAEMFNSAVAKALALPKKKGPLSYSTRLVGTMSSSSESEPQPKSSNIFKSFRKRRASPALAFDHISPPSSDDEDDFLTSLAPTRRSGNIFSSPSVLSGASSLGSPTYCESIESAGSIAAMTKPVDIVKSNILVDMFRDIWESTTGDILPDVREPPSLYSTTDNETMPNLVNRLLGSDAISRSRVLDLYEQLVNLEYTYVQHMTELYDVSIQNYFL